MYELNTKKCPTKYIKIYQDIQNTKRRRGRPTRPSPAPMAPGRGGPVAASFFVYLGISLHWIFGYTLKGKKGKSKKDKSKFWIHPFWIYPFWVYPSGATLFQASS